MRRVRLLYLSLVAMGAVEVLRRWNSPPPAVQACSNEIGGGITATISASSAKNRNSSTTASSMIMVVGHLRNYEHTLERHHMLARMLEQQTGEPPSICVVTYMHRKPPKLTRKKRSNMIFSAFALPPTLPYLEANISADFGTRPCAFHFIGDLDVSELDWDKDAIVQQQAKLSYAVHLGVFSSFSKAYTLCAQSFAPRVFDLVVRTRPDSFFDIDKLRPGIRHIIANKDRIGVAGCNRNRSLPGGDFSDVAFVATRAFWELYVSTFDAGSIFQELYERPCMEYQKGRPKEITAKGPTCCDVPACKQIYTEMRQECNPDAPPCSFSPETFFKWWMNSHQIGSSSPTSESSSTMFGLETGAVYISREQYRNQGGTTSICF